MPEDLFLYSDENLIAQLKRSVFELGYYRLRFYAKNGLPSASATDEIKDFYLYPSGGTLRDSDFNIVFYSTRYDIYKGFAPPHLRKKA